MSPSEPRTRFGARGHLGRNAKGTHFFHRVKALRGTCCSSELDFEAPQEPFSQPIPQWAGGGEGSEVGSANAARAADGGSGASATRPAVGGRSERGDAQVDPESARECNSAHRVKARSTGAIEAGRQNGLQVSP
jgi:hypothetical protein